jgi:hypothetical protein
MAAVAKPKRIMKSIPRLFSAIASSAAAAEMLWRAGAIFEIEDISLKAASLADCREMKRKAGGAHHPRLAYGRRSAAS